MKARTCEERNLSVRALERRQSCMIGEWRRGSPRKANHYDTSTLLNFNVVAHIESALSAYLGLTLSHGRSGFLDAYPTCTLSSKKTRLLFEFFFKIYL